MTRLADVTGLDWMGVPVFQAVRPWSRALSVHQGKALTVEAAQLGALMEAVESHHAEAVQPALEAVGFSNLPPSERPPELSDFAVARGSAPADHEPAAWVAAHRLLDGARLWVPFDSVSLDFTRRGDPRLDRGSDGLAAHFSLEAASTTAVLELIERDALASWRAGALIDRSRTRVDLDSIPFAWFDGLRERIAAGDVHLAVYRLPPVIALPCFACELIEIGARRGSGSIYGTACHPDPETALLAAVLEAIQSRLTYISGARDDVFSGEPGERGGLGFGAPLPPGVAAQPWKSGGPAMLPDACELAAALAGAGFPSTAIVDLSSPGGDVFVVKAVSPGLAGVSRGRRTWSPG